MTGVQTCALPILLNYPYNVYIPSGNKDFDTGYHAGSAYRNAFSGVWSLSGGDPDKLDPTIDNGVAGYPANLWAQFDNTVSVATINQLRTAFQIQKFYERSARGGSRYIETLKAHLSTLLDLHQSLLSDDSQASLKSLEPLSTLPPVP